MSAECERLFGVAEQMVPPLRTRLEASTIGIAQTLRPWVRNGLVDAADSLIDVSEEVGNSVIWEAEEDDLDAGNLIKAAAQKLESDFGVLDVLVNNAGISGKEEVSRENFHTVFDTNVFSTMLLTQALEHLLRKSRDPRIINVSSVLGSITVRNDHSSPYTQVTGETYRVSKAALNMVTGIQAYKYKEWEHPAKVWSFCPGFVVTNLTGEDKQSKIDRGAESSETSAQGITEIVRGDRDDEVNQFLAKRGEVLPW
ncbi:hypothetical protein FOVG_19334 [Fusarium oxysporum f. sp. pisi HDV247]|uniref:Short chain dehydrogenase n=1 Tax=Fusarium oxysporum f. sp. pisi HDV247 TaxID=1080344 RepID=W9NEG9_FUSOX|nr:hypothetical protein FOVG_19334 [Fusarium oxysporum f. sp. pisi HDV247]